MGIIEYLKKGLQNPEEAPPFLLSKVIPDSVLYRTQKYLSLDRKEDDYVTFEYGGFSSTSDNRAEFSATIYYEVNQLKSILDDYGGFEKSLEVGSGYGRLSPWIANYSENHTAIDPNQKTVDVSSELYPMISFKNERIQDFETQDSYNLVVSWMVLQHIPDSDIESVCDTISNHTCEDCTIVLCECTEGESTDVFTPRSKGEYESMLDGFELVHSEQRA